MRDRAALAPAIRVLTLTVGHGNIFWTPGNWLPESIRDTVRAELRWSATEVEQLIAITDPEEWDRGGLGQDVHALLDADPNVNHAIENVYVTTTNDDVAHRCLLILIDAAGRDGLAEWSRLIDRRPALATDDLALELRRLLEEFGFFTLW